MSIFGMPLDAWALLLVSVGSGLGLELAFMRARRREGARGPRRGSAADTPGEHARPESHG